MIFLFTFFNLISSEYMRGRDIYLVNSAEFFGLQGKSEYFSIVLSFFTMLKGVVRVNEKKT